MAWSSSGPRWIAMASPSPSPHRWLLVLSIDHTSDCGRTLHQLITRGYLTTRPAHREWPGSRDVSVAATLTDCPGGAGFRNLFREAALSPHIAPKQVT